MRILITGGSGFIGTNLVNAYSEDPTVELLNLDRKQPFRAEHMRYWRPHDFLDKAATIQAVQEFAPEIIVHLAARAECDEATTVEKGYADNTVAVANLLEAVQTTPSVQRLVMTSTQYVFRPIGRQVPAHDEDYDPHTIYGQSKVITEQLTRQAGLDCCWFFVRPTTVWGPWCYRYVEGFFRVLQKGLYFHPTGADSIRSYGYVGNVCWQIQKLIELPATAVQGKAWYVGDRSGPLLPWVNAFAIAWTGKKAKRFPRFLMQWLAWFGDWRLRTTGKRFLMDSTRLQSMTQDYDTPMEATFRLLGEPPYSLEAGVKETVRWARSVSLTGDANFEKLKEA